MCSGENIPFFPDFEIETLCDGNLCVNWFETKFCQSRYNKQNSHSGSNACTLIAVILAAECYQEKLQLFGPEKSLNSQFIYSFARSILDGNKIHIELKSKGILSNINLTVPEAIEHASKHINVIPKEWKSILYMESLKFTLFDNIKKYWLEWNESSLSNKHKDLYIILISCARSVLFIMNHAYETISLVDSHQHSSARGAFIAVVKQQKLKLLCQWFGELMDRYYHSESELYELSFIYFLKHRKKRD